MEDKNAVLEEASARGVPALTSKRRARQGLLRLQMLTMIIGGAWPRESAKLDPDRPLCRAEGLVLILQEASSKYKQDLETWLLGHVIVVRQQC